MKRGKVGKAFEDAVTGKPSKPETRKTRAQMMNPVRREIFEYLCKHPCSNVSRISGAMNRSIHTVQWHLKKLIEHRYVASRKFAGIAVYYPIGLLEPDDLSILEALNIEKARDVFLRILNDPGLTQGEVSVELGTSHQSVNRVAERLKGLGLIDIVDDGRFKRYYPSNIMANKREGNKERTKGFMNVVLDRLESEGLDPTVIKSSDVEIQIQISRGKERAVLRLSSDPFATVLA